MMFNYDRLIAALYFQTMLTGGLWPLSHETLSRCLWKTNKLLVHFGESWALVFVTHMLIVGAELWVNESTLSLMTRFYLLIKQHVLCTRSQLRNKKAYTFTSQHEASIVQRTQSACTSFLSTCLQSFIHYFFITLWSIMIMLLSESPQKRSRYSRCAFYYSKINLKVHLKFERI